MFIRINESAAKVAPKRADIQQLRAQYFAKTGDKKREMEAYEMLLGALGEDEGPAYAHITAMLARVGHVTALSQSDY